MILICGFAENVFDTLYHSISTRWRPQHDIPYPFGDTRECLVHSSWIVDLDNDLVTLRKKGRNHYQIRLSQVLQKQTASVDDMHPMAPLLSPQLTTGRDFRNSTWHPEVTLTSHQSAFTVKLLNDLMYQWRHIFRAPYNDMTFRQLASAIIRIVTLDFAVKEIPHGRAGTGRVVWLADLPSWKPVSDHVIRFDRVSVVICQYSAHAMELIRDDLFKRRQLQRKTEDGSTPDNCVSIKYLVLSVREIFLFKTCTCRKHPSITTKPEGLFNGIDPPSERALAYLHMIAPRVQYRSSPLHALPLELQVMILRHASSGLVESARIGCAMSLGTPFQWKGYWGDIKNQNVFITRTSVTAVESQIWFDEYPGGLVYK
ncbi:hypothetical protein FQN50_004797 [Emmonsiellopsis sp. PD_5]|nr:hypothetical protein FQN50_004797 [Emmonsiellopsis sp. PD_5]